LGGAGDTAEDPERPRPKRPEVLITTAATGDGVPELLAALDRHRAAVAAHPTAAARLARADALVWAIVAERLHGRLRGPGLASVTERTLGEVAAHRLDPYAAADELRGRLAGRPGGPGRAEDGGDAGDVDG
jgi:LAO/AO transport system kinase